MTRVARRAIGLAVGMLLFAGGCGSQEKPVAPGPGSESKSGASMGPGASAESPSSEKPTEPPATPPPPPPPTTIPKVVMDQARRATFRIWVGDSLPDGQLQDLQGRPVPLRSLWASKWTVLVFWHSESLSGLQELQDLAKDVLPKYQDKGVQVIAVNVGEEPPVVQKTLPAEATHLPILLDADGAYFAQIVQQSPKPQIELLPRTYIVDGNGKVLWLDMGYIESTLRGIEITLQVVTGQPGSSE